MQRKEPCPLPRPWAQTEGPDAPPSHSEAEKNSQQGQIIGQRHSAEKNYISIRKRERSSPCIVLPDTEPAAETSLATPTSSPSPLSHDDLPLHLRKKKMKATDCLLFAATLLEDASGTSALSAKQSNGQTQQVPGDIDTDMKLRACPVDPADPSRPREVDVLCGRGGLINKHPGNIIYRRVVEHNKSFYSTVQKKHRILVSQSIVQSMLNFGCRFLTMGTKNKNGATGGNTSWTEIDFKRAVQKTSQALREKPLAVVQEDGDEHCVYSSQDLRMIPESFSNLSKAKGWVTH